MNWTAGSLQFVAARRQRRELGTKNALTKLIKPHTLIRAQVAIGQRGVAESIPIFSSRNRLCKGLEAGLGYEHEEA